MRLAKILTFCIVLIVCGCVGPPKRGVGQEGIRLAVALRWSDSYRGQSVAIDDDLYEFREIRNKAPLFKSIRPLTSAKASQSPPPSEYWLQFESIDIQGRDAVAIAETLVNGHLLNSKEYKLRRTRAGWVVVNERDILV